MAHAPKILSRLLLAIGSLRVKIFLSQDFVSTLQFLNNTAGETSLQSTLLQLHLRKPKGLVER